MTAASSFDDRFAHLVTAVDEANGSASVHELFDASTLVMAPRAVPDIVDIIRHANAERTSIGIVGSGSTYRSMPGWSCDVAIDMSRIDTVIAYEPEDLTLAVGAGATLAQVSRVLEPHRQTAILPEGEPHRTVGGVVATGDSGYRRLRYGPTRDRVVGVRIVTGYGEVVMGGGRLVKNVTGYDVPRLVTGSHGVLGVIVEVCLKLWPEPGMRWTLPVDDAADAYNRIFRPSAILETEQGTSVYLEGSAGAVETSRALFGSAGAAGHAWPRPIDSAVRVSVRVPPRSVGDAVAHIRGLDPDRFVAQHGVGRIDIGWEDFDADALARLRRFAATVAGIVVVTAWPGTTTLDDRWGVTPDGAGIQRNLKQLFDPVGVLNAGRLPGGL